MKLITTILLIFLIKTSSAAILCESSFGQRPGEVLLASGDAVSENQNISDYPTSTDFRDVLPGLVAITKNSEKLYVRLFSNDIKLSLPIEVSNPEELLFNIGEYTEKVFNHSSGDWEETDLINISYSTRRDTSPGLYIKQGGHSVHMYSSTKCFEVNKDFDLRVLNDSHKLKSPWQCGLKKFWDHDKVQEIKKMVNNDNLISFIPSLYFNLVEKDALYDLGLDRKFTGDEIRNCVLLRNEFINKIFVDVDLGVNQNGRGRNKEAPEKKEIKHKKGSSAIVD